jgi:hypothetical protein
MQVMQAMSSAYTGAADSVVAGITRPGVTRVVAAVAAVATVGAIGAAVLGRFSKAEQSKYFLVNGVTIIYDTVTKAVGVCDDVGLKRFFSLRSFERLDIPEDIQECKEMDVKQKALAVVIRKVLESDKPWCTFKMCELVDAKIIKSYLECYAKKGVVTPLAFTNKPDENSDRERRGMDPFASEESLDGLKVYKRVMRRLIKDSKFSVGPYLSTTRPTGSSIGPHLDFDCNRKQTDTQVIFYPEIKGLNSELSLISVPKTDLRRTEANFVMLSKMFPDEGEYPIVLKHSITEGSAGSAVIWNGSKVDDTIFHQVSPVGADKETHELDRVRVNVPGMYNSQKNLLR